MCLINSNLDRNSGSIDCVRKRALDGSDESDELDLSSEFGEFLNYSPSPLSPIKEISDIMVNSNKKAKIDSTEESSDSQYSITKVNVPTENRFELFNSDVFAQCAYNLNDSLDSADDVINDTKANDSCDSTRSSRNMNLRIRRPPPIYIKIIPNEIFNFSRELEKAVGKNFRLKHLGDQIRVQFNDVDVFSKAKKDFLKSGVQFHTFTLPNERHLSVVLKGLPDVDVNELCNELKSQNLKPTKCVAHRVGNNNTIYRITFPPGTAFTQVCRVNYLYYFRVYWEKFKKGKNYTQCFRCQAYGHASGNCNKTPKCVKCGGEHMTKNCAKPPDAPPKCANCNGDHTANFRECPKLHSYRNRRNENSMRGRPRNIVASGPNTIPVISNRTTSTIRPGKSFRDAVRGSNGKAQALPASGEPNNIDSSSFTSSFGEVNDLFKEIFTFVRKAVPLIRTIRPKLASCSNIFDKIEVIVEAAQLLFT